MTNLNMLLVCLLLTTVVVLSVSFGNSVYADSKPNLPFDNATYFFDHAFILNVTDIAQAQLNTQVIYVKVTSSVESGHLYPLGLSDSRRGIYLSQPINFTTMYGSTNAMLKVSNTDQISAFYPTTATSSSATSGVVSSDYGTIPQPPNLNALVSSPTQVLWGKVVYDCSRYGGNVAKDGICDAWKIPVGQQYNGLKIPYLAPLAGGDVNGSYKLQCDPNASYDPYSTNYDPLGIHVCPEIGMPDVYVQVDWMKGHKPNISALSDVVQSFWHAPVKTCYPLGSNNCKTGIKLHIQLGNELPFHKDVIISTISGGAGGTDFDGIKNVYFGTADERSKLDQQWLWQQNLTSKKQVFHYAMYIHSRAESPTSSGFSEQPGNDMAISLGRFTDAIGSIDQQEGTFMHELGHNLGLDHGGNVTDNCKPNYLSVMSYSRQFNESYPISRPLDYSHSALPLITENSLSESSGVGISNPPNLQTVYGVPTGQLFKTTWAGNSARQTLWLQFENNVQDSSGLGNSATVVNPKAINTFTTNAKIGSYAFTSDGSTYVNVANSPSVDLSGAWTISTWTKFNVLGQQQSIVEKYDWTPTGGGYAIRLGSDGHVYVYIINGQSAQGLVSNAVLSANTWYHIVATFDNNGHLNLYINSILDRTNPSITMHSMSSSASLKVGARGDDAGTIINGAIDDLQIRNYAMSASEVQNLLGDQTPSTQTLWLQFENNAQDSSGLGNSATVVNPKAINTFTTNAKIGSYAFTSDGSTYVNVANSPSVDLRGAWTISTWTKFNVVNQQQAIIEKYDWTPTGGGYAIRLGSDGHVYVYIINGQSAQGLVSNAVLSANTWYHIVATFDNNGHLNLYINGTLDSTNPSITMHSMSSSASLKVGARGDDAGTIINGVIDDLQIRNYAMSASDVRKFPESQSGMDANGNGIIDPGVISGPLAVNYLPAAGCDGSTVTPNILKGYDDWDNLMLNSKNFSGWSDGIKVVNYGAGASVSISGSTPPTDVPAYPTITSPNFVTGTTSTYRNIHNPFSGMDNSTTESFNYEKGISGPSHRPHNPNNMPEKSTIVSDYKPPGITTDSAKRNQLVNWLKTWGWKLLNNHNYTLPDEITMGQVRDIRSEKIQSINDHISILPIFVFSNGSSDKIFLNQTITQVGDYVKQDDLFDANYLLMNMSSEIKHRIILPYPKEMILSQINKIMTGFTIASTTSSPPPSVKTTNTPLIQLDKNVYSWTDRVYITVVSPKDNWDPNIVDTIGDGVNGTISISTEKQKLTNYRLVESGVNTGVFTGYITLTGFEHDAFGDGNGIPPGTTSGVGPTSGLLKANRIDHLTVMFKRGDQVTEQSVPINWNIGQISWSKTVYSTSDTAMLQVIDPDLNIHPTIPDQFSILVNSTSDPVGINVNMIETSADSGIFQGIVHTSTSGSSGNQILHVANGGTIIGYYIDRTLPLPYKTNDVLYKMAKAKIGSSAPPQQISATNVRIVDPFGNLVPVAQIDKPIQVTIDITNGLNREQPFAYVVQIQDANGVSVSTSWITGTIAAGQSLSPSLSWNPSASGTYTVQAFLWQSLDNPNSLAPPLTMTLTVQ